MQPENNPYAPPKSLELEPAPESGPGWSKHVEWACTLMWIGLGLSTFELVITTLLNLKSSGIGAEFVGGVIGLGIGFLIVYWFTLKLRAGRNWMRWLITILTSVGLLALAFIAMALGRYFFIGMYEASPLQTGDAAIQMVLAVVELVLINTPASRRWFHARSYG